MNAPIGLCFCHGWGFHPDFWNSLLPYFKEFPIQRWNLGYFGEEDLPAPTATADRWIAVGHSLGFRKLIESGYPWSGAVALQGFTDFLGSEPRLRKIRERFLESMIKGWKKDRSFVLNQFYRIAQGNDLQPFPGACSWERLEADLISLSDSGDWKSQQKIPLRVIGAKDDLVVTPPLMQSEWGNDLILWSEKGGHLLGIFESDFVAQSIHDLIREVRENRHP